jgi:two-component system response regulator AtoC
MACILVVDDEKLVRWSISKGLNRDSHEVVCAQDGEQAIAEAKETAFDLVITDFKMPGMNGAELLTHLKRLNPAPKVMILTAYSAELSRQSAMDLGACEYIEKPFLVDEIRRIVQTLLSEQ